MKLSTGEINRRLAVKYGGTEWATFFEVADSTGAASGYMDMLAMNLWSSRGYAIHGFEVKASRGDWLKELKTPKKADLFFNRVDYWWLVIGDKEIVKPGELPDTWGLIQPHGSGLSIKTKATKIKATYEFNRSWLAAILRRASVRPPTAEEAEIKRVNQEYFQMGKQDEKNTNARLQANWEKQNQKYIALVKTLSEFEDATGISIASHRWGQNSHTADDFKHFEAFRKSRDPQRMRDLSESLAKLADSLEAAQPERIVQ